MILDRKWVWGIGHWLKVKSQKSKVKSQIEFLILNFELFVLLVPTSHAPCPMPYAHYR